MTMNVLFCHLSMNVFQSSQVSKDCIRFKSFFNFQKSILIGDIQQRFESTVLAADASEVSEKGRKIVGEKINEYLHCFQRLCCNILLEIQFRIRVFPSSLLIHSIFCFSFRIGRYNF